MSSWLGSGGGRSVSVPFGRQVSLDVVKQHIQLAHGFIQAFILQLHTNTHFTVLACSVIVRKQHKQAEHVLDMRNSGIKDES